MTGQIAFSKTLRALDADDFRASKLSIVLALVTLVAWIWWMVTPSVAQFQELDNATIAWVDPHHASLRDLPSTGVARLQNGQAIQLRFDNRSASARVASMSFWKIGEHENSLIVLDVLSNIALPLPSRATIEIETNRISPAQALLRALQ